MLERIDGGSAAKRAWSIAWHALADLALAILFLLTLGFFLAVVFEAYNQLAL